MARLLPLVLLLHACGGLKPLDLPAVVDEESDAPDSEPVWTDDTLDSPDDPDTEPPGDSDAAPWSHAPTLDGDLSDWVVGTEFPTSSGGETRTYVSWDAANLYVAARHPDVGRSALHWLVITLGDGTQGGSQGMQLGDQLPVMDFPATTIVRWKSDNSWNSRLDWDGAAWTDAATWLGTAGSAVASDGDQAVEFKLPRSTLPAGDQLVLHVHWVFEGEPASSYAATPADSFADGDDPDLTAWLTLDLQDPTPPNQRSPSR